VDRENPSLEEYRNAIGGGHSGAAAWKKMPRKGACRANQRLNLIIEFR
jgi:hypothetical protein